MNLDNLASELSQLKNIKADQTWKENNRDILLCQIQNNYSDVSVLFDKKSFNIFKIFSQPVFAAFSILTLLISGGAFSVYAANSSKPGDSLYIAKIISEKAQMAVTFDNDAKNKLGLKFANDRAQKIAEVLSHTDSESEKDKTDQLSGDFQKEIVVVKTKMNSIKILNKNNDNIDSVNNQKPEDDPELYSAGLGKDNKGVQVSDPVAIKIDEINNQKTASNTNQIIENNTSTSTPGEINIPATPEKMVEDAEKMFGEKDYEGAQDKLKEVGQIINNSLDDKNIGEVKGITESATSTTK